jgi:5-methylthioribose kinase
MTAQVKKLITPQGYYALSPETVVGYLVSFQNVTERLGGKSSEWKAREVGDGNLNLVFIVEGPKGGVVVKQALPYVRLVGESWPLPLSRAHFEYLALEEEAKWAAPYVPKIYQHDADMALTVMEFLSPHIILRKGLIRGVTYPKMAQHLGEFLAQTLYHTSDLHLSATAKKEKIATFLTNTAMCKITEDLVFDEPYFAAPMNRNTPQIDDIAQDFRKDADLTAAAQEMKWRFQNAPEAMIHGDFHTGSVMVTETDTRAIDPEFAFYGPMGFDVGEILANFFMAYFSQPAHEKKVGEREDYMKWLAEQGNVLWNTFEQRFRYLVASQKGDILQPRITQDAHATREKFIEQRTAQVWDDTLGFAGCKMIRRILGLAHVEDFESIEDTGKRAACERRALNFGRQLLINRGQFKTIADVTSSIQS